MRKLIFLSFIFVLVASSCSRFSRNDSTDPSTSPSSDSRTEEIDYSQYNARFLFTENTASNSLETSVEAKRSLANFFFYNEERIVAAGSTVNDSVKQKDLSSSLNEKFVWCDFKTKAQWNSFKYDWSTGSYPPYLDKSTCKSKCRYAYNGLCGVIMSGDKGACCVSCNVHCDSGTCDTDALLPRLYSKGLISVPFVASTRGRFFVENYQKNVLWMIDNNANISGTGTDIKDLNDTDMCYNASAIAEKSSYWDFEGYYNENGKDRVEFIVAAPKKVKSIESMELEFGFNIDANRNIIEDNGSYLKLDFKIEGTDTSQDFVATFVYSKDNLVITADTCSSGAVPCTKSLEVEFSDICGRLKVIADLHFETDAVTIQYPKVIYRNSRDAYANAQCHYIGEQTGSNNALTTLPRSVLDGGDDWVKLYMTTAGNGIIMNEIK